MNEYEMIDDFQSYHQQQQQLNKMQFFFVKMKGIFFHVFMRDEKKLFSCYQQYFLIHRSWFIF